MTKQAAHSDKKLGLAGIAILIVLLGLGVGMWYGYYSDNSVVISTEKGARYEEVSRSINPSSEAFVGATIKGTEDRYAPESVAIKQGEAVEFINKGKQAIWPKSTVFDAGAPLQPGDSWSVEFGQVGTIEFYDFIYPHIKGTIIVE